jgi:hypothetical protein
MARYKNFNDIVLDIMDYLRMAQPSLDIKPNSVARDLFVDSQAFQIAQIYDAINEVAALQSITNLSGLDLTNYGINYGIQRQDSTKAFGSVVFTFRSLTTDVSIPAGSIVRTRSGTSFMTTVTVYISTTQSNSLRANAIKWRQDLYTAGITDEYAIEVSVEAQSPGTSGNVSKFSVINHNVANVNVVTNLSNFIGGNNLESDSSFRSRVLATFSGANTGTALAYRSIILNLANAIDALVIEPGDTLMTRDGSIVLTDSNGTQYLSEPGTGGKVDIYVMGETTATGIDSFVYSDNSGRADPTDSSNDFILGQSNTTASTDTSFNSRRVNTFSGEYTIPTQPISRIVSVSGSISGPNFIEQYTDSNGLLKGNYKLVKDEGSAGGSPFGLDKFAWTDSKIDLSDESSTKGLLNSVDGLSFVDVSTIDSIYQNTQVVNENSTVSGTLRNYVTTIHSPIKTISRVYNTTTGERYIIADQNPDGTGDINNTGKVKISGKTLPTASDVLQVDYMWVRSFDSSVDFDNFNPRDKFDSSQDSVEWGFSNYIRDENKEAVLDVVYNNLTVTTDFNVSRLLEINSFVTESSIVAGSGVSKIIQVTNSVTNVNKIIDSSITGSPEVFNTTLGDGSFSNTVIVLPTDTIAEIGDVVGVTYNLVDIVETTGGVATFTNNKITLTPYDIVPSGTQLKVSYVANFYNLLPQTNISSLPVSGDGKNSFVSVGGYQPVQNEFSSNIVVSNKRRSPTNIKVTVSNIPNNGTLRIVGTTINKVDDFFVTSASNSLDLLPLIRNAEGTNTISSNIYVARVISVESGEVSITGEFVPASNYYDLKNYSINNSQWDRENAVELSTLTSTQVKLAENKNNNSNQITTGTALRVVFYYAKTSDYEDIFFSRSGSLITKKSFGYVSSINKFSGFQNSAGTVSGKFILDSFNQPENSSSYFVNYNYLAPKENERITINYEYNKLIVDASQAIENKRPVTADILVKQATKVEIDVTANIVVTQAYKNSAQSVKQDVSDNISSALTASQLETTIDASDVVNSVYNVVGVDRVRITVFNIHGEIGYKNSISAGKNEYLAPGNITVNIEER